MAKPATVRLFFLNPENTMEHFKVFEQNLLFSPLLSDGKASGLSRGK